MNACIVVERSNITIDGAGHTLQGDGGGSGFSLSYVDNVTIKRTNIKGYSNGIAASYSSGNTISENNITKNQWYGIVLHWYCSNNTITKNNITENNDVGINIQLYSNNNTICENNIAKNGGANSAMSCGVWITQDCSYNIIRGNNITDNHLFGVNLASGNFNTICENYFARNGHSSYWRDNLAYDDCALYIACSCNVVRGNNITANLGWGVFLNGGSNNTIIENTITNNGEYGITVSGVYHNLSRNIINNNRYNFGVGPPMYIWIPDSHMNFIDTSNLVNGKPVYYFYRCKDLVINPENYPEIGYLGLVECNNVTVENLTMANNQHGILLLSTNNSRVVNNQVANNEYGIELANSYNNTITANDMKSNWAGMDLCWASNTKFRNNSMSGNVYNLYTWGETAQDYVYDMDSSNTVNGKPVYYWVNMENATVPMDAGYVGLINCANITVKNLTITNVDSLVMFNTRNSHVINNTIANTMFAINIWDSPGNRFSQNKLTNNTMGMSLGRSPNNIVSQNKITNSANTGILIESPNQQILQNQITNNKVGVFLFYYSSPSTVSGNNITNNGIGVDIHTSGNTVSGNNVTDNAVGVYFEEGVLLYNRFYHNNFVNNAQQIASRGYTQYWDKGAFLGGNYWSDYKGKDTNRDGFGDTPYIIDLNNQDNYPLMGPFHSFNAGTWGGVSFNVDIVSNSTITNFSFSPDDKALYFDVEGENDTKGFCRVAIPTGLMWCDNINEWTLTVGGTLTEADMIIEQGNYTYIYFTYSHSTTTIKIKSTYAVPEFPQPFTMSLLIVAALLATATYRVKMKKHA
jgi:parallel beta-helix repeat protein